MAFEVFDWKNGEAGGTRLNATNLNNLEARIREAIEAIEAAIGEGGGEDLDEAAVKALIDAAVEVEESAREAADAALIAKALVDAKGDILTATADNTPARLAVGANGKILSADSSQSTGLKWIDPPEGGGEPNVVVEKIGSELDAARPEAESVIWVATGQPENATEADIVILEGGYTRREAFTFHLGAGEVTAQTLPGFWVPVLSGETAKVVAMHYAIASGTSVKVSLTKNGSTVEGFSGKEAKSSAAETTGEVSLANKDRLGLVTESPSGTPKGLVVTVWVEYTR